MFLITEMVLPIALYHAMTMMVKYKVLILWPNFTHSHEQLNGVENVSGP